MFNLFAYCVFYTVFHFGCSKNGRLENVFIQCEMSPGYWSSGEVEFAYAACNFAMLYFRICFLLFCQAQPQAVAFVRRKWAQYSVLKVLGNKQIGEDSRKVHHGTYSKRSVWPTVYVQFTIYSVCIKYKLLCVNVNRKSLSNNQKHFVTMTFGRNFQRKACFCNIITITVACKCLVILMVNSFEIRFISLFSIMLTSIITCV